MGKGICCQDEALIMLASAATPCEPWRTRWGASPALSTTHEASVRLSETRSTYPDASVSCDSGDQPTTERMQVPAPRVVVEVLSDSTEGQDRIRKAHLSRACPTIQEYVLIATSKNL